MKTETIHTLVLGAGPSGLAAGYTLAKAGLAPVVLERDKVCGGLMRSFRHGDFTLDIGRKELYNRLAKVDAFWSELLGRDYRSYAHRGGILYHGRILDMSPAYRGFRRGMSWGMFFGCCLDFAGARLAKRSPRNLQEYYYGKRGRRLTQIFSQGFQEKLTGKRWADVPVAEEATDGSEGGFLGTLKAAVARTFSEKEVNTYKGIWRHPARGTGQICEAMAEGITAHGGRVCYQAQIRGAETDERSVNVVTAQVGSEELEFRPQHVVSSVPIEVLVKLVSPDSAAAAGQRPKVPSTEKRTVVLVYLFFDEEPRFPQAWLQVTCPSTRIGRITNYSAFSGDMVPKGKTCLCCEFYCFGPDELLNRTDAEIGELALNDCKASGLVDPARCFDRLVLRLPGADASQNRDNWMSKSRLKLMAAIEPFKNLYYVNRTETDIATLAGIEAAEAILSGDRADFDRRVDPAQLQIRSENKAFEFKAPALETA